MTEAGRMADLQRGRCIAVMISFANSIRAEREGSMAQRYWTSMLTVIFLLAGLAAAPAVADKKYGPGVTDTEIKVGQTYPYSGPLSAYATIARTEAAVFAKLNVRR